MKKILITGENSYIGMGFEKYLKRFSDKYSIDTVDMINGSWEKKDFSEYHVVFHVAGIAHIKETKKNSNVYYEVNRDLAHKVAKKCKTEGVLQFVFLSTMSVYGMERGEIDEHTPLVPKSNYGKSKLQAEELIKDLESKTFNVAILRPPMVYGKGCKGNYPRLAGLAKKVPIFPSIDNKRSMIYIDNLCEFIRLIIEDSAKGLFCPQNSEYVKTSEMIRLIAKIHGKHIRMTKIFNPIILLIRTNTMNKVFGDLYYTKTLSKYKKSYMVSDFRQSINKTEL